MSRTLPRILIIGATGSVGAEAAAACVAAGADVRALVRSPSAALPDGVRPVSGDLADAPSVTAALKDIDAALYVSPHHAREEELGRSFVAAASAVPRLVFAGAFHPYSRYRPLHSVLCWATGLVGPHYRPKLAIEQLMRRRDAVVLMPTNFFQNDDLFRQELVRDGVYPLPLGRRGVNAVDTRDIGDAAARALLDPSVAPGPYPLVGPDSPTGAERAAAWAEALGRDVRYAGDDIDTWDRLVADRMNDAKRQDFKKTLAVLQRFGAPTSGSDLAATTALLGRAPRSFADYARDRAREWRSRAA